MRGGEVLVVVDAAAAAPRPGGVRNGIERGNSTRARMTDVRRPESESDFLGRHRVARTSHSHADRETARPEPSVGRHRTAVGSRIVAIKIIIIVHDGGRYTAENRAPGLCRGCLFFVFIYSVRFFFFFFC